MELPQSSKRRRDEKSEDDDLILSVSDRATLRLLSKVPAMNVALRDRRGRRGAVFVGDLASDAFIDALGESLGSTGSFSVPSTLQSEALPLTNTREATNPPTPPDTLALTALQFPDKGDSLSSKPSERRGEELARSCTGRSSSPRKATSVESNSIIDRSIATAHDIGLTHDEVTQPEIPMPQTLQTTTSTSSDANEAIIRM